MSWIGQRLRIRATILVTVSALSLTACTSYPVAQTPDGDPIEAARALSGAPATVQRGVAADTCGEFVLDQAETVPAEAVACLDDAAAAGMEAEVAWSWPTSEGDPIVQFASVTSVREGIVVFTTNAFDSYGGDFGWAEYVCSDAAAAVSGVGCRVTGDD